VNRTVTWDGDFEKRIDSLTPAQIRDAMARHLDPERISFVKAGDFARAQAAAPAR
jgi:zinc protease